ncbi:MAG: hypothetical protein MRZ79_17195 [Bacteroidia bacterium]|nr:hypothetical protein [Bacteroidia bacterium]
MTPILRLPTLLLFSVLLFACQPENPLTEEEEKVSQSADPKETELMIGKWNIARHAVVIKGGAIKSEDAGFILLEKGGEGEAQMTHEGSKHEKKHSIKWSYDKDKKEISIDHKDGKKAKIYKVKDKESDYQKWQAEEFDSYGQLTKMTEILLRK